MSSDRRFTGFCAWFSDGQQQEDRAGSIERAILRPAGLVMDVVTGSERYSVRLDLTGPGIYQGTWASQDAGRMVSGEAECTTGPVIKTLGLGGTAAEEPGILQYQGRWTERGEWLWYGRLEEVEQFE
jgi:hypothetical protein